MNLAMGTIEQDQSEATILCKSCGLCCTGHLFAWAKLRSSEMETAKALGLTVFSSDARQRGFNQPCPLWDGECTIYASPQYPHFCHVYKCKLLKKVVDETTPLPEALTVVQRAKEMINDVELLLPASTNRNFRERLVAHIEDLERSTDLGKSDVEFRQKARELLNFYKNHFGVKDLVDISYEP
jgi:hypothetical protein